MKINELLENGKTIAYYDEKSRQQSAKILTREKLMKMLNDESTLPQIVLNKLAKQLVSVNGEITQPALKDILRLADIDTNDAREIMDMVSDLQS